MIATPDREIVGAANALATRGVLRPGDSLSLQRIVVSLEHCRGGGCRRARGSVHPLKTFADPHDASHVSGTYCAAKRRRGARVLALRSSKSAAHLQDRPAVQTVYHAASVMVAIT